MRLPAASSSVMVSGVAAAAGGRALAAGAGPAAAGRLACVHVGDSASAAWCSAWFVTCIQRFSSGLQCDSQGRAASECSSPPAGLGSNQPVWKAGMGCAGWAARGEPQRLPIVTVVLPEDVMPLGPAALSRQQGEGVASRFVGSARPVCTQSRPANNTIRCL